MTINDEELLSQYLDGELPTSESARLELRLSAEPELHNSLQQMRQVNESLKSTFNTARARSVPARIIKLLARSDSQSSDSRPSEKLGAADNVVAFPGRQRKASWGFAIAASIMAASGLLFVQGTGQQLAGPSPASDTLLAQELESAPSRGEGWDVLADGREVLPLLTYARIGGGWCREYLLSSQDGHSHGIACRRDEGNWITEALDTQAQQAGSADVYRTAGAGDSNQIAEFMGGSAAGVALSAQEEQELISKGWR